MTNLVYTAYPEADLREIADSLNQRRSNKCEIVRRFGLPEDQSRRYLKVPQLWRGLQAVFTGADTPDNAQLIAAIDGIEYLDGWSDMGAAYILPDDTAAIAAALAKVDFAARLAAFNADLAQNAEELSAEADLAAFAEAFHIRGSEEFDHSDSPERAEELGAWFARLCGFYRAAAADGCGVIVSFVEHV